MSTQSIAAIPGYFGDNEQLFGFYHGVAGKARAAVLLCPPLGQDLVRSHRVYRQLAETLATRSIASLRFDYFGSGDSAGSAIEVDWQRCQADLLTAAAELRQRSACQRLVGFGARLGGSLVLASAVAAEFSETIAWDPVLDGAAHVAQLDALQDQLRLDPMRFSRSRSSADAAGQWLGFPVSALLHQQVAALHVEPPALRTLLLDSSPSGSLGELVGVPQATGVRVTALTPATMWNALDRLEHAVLSPGLIRAVVNQLAAAT
jgi:hypothetical protein